jgi:hypothetical protein
VLSPLPSATSRHKKQTKAIREWSGNRLCVEFVTGKRSGVGDHSITKHQT